MMSNSPVTQFVNISKQHTDVVLAVVGGLLGVISDHDRRLRELALSVGILRNLQRLLVGSQGQNNNFVRLTTEQRALCATLLRAAPSLLDDELSDLTGYSEDDLLRAAREIAMT
jgi:hypothetical protein